MKYLDFFKIFILIIKLKCRFSFIPPKPKKYLIFDLVSEPFLKQYFKKNTYNTLATRFEEINFFIFVKSLFLKEKTKLSLKYILAYIKYAQPTHIITNIDNNLTIFKIKRFFNNKKIIVIQNGIRSFQKHYDIKNNLQAYKKMNLRCDYFLILSKRFKNEYSSFIKSRYINTGSINSNMIKISRISNNKVVYISQFVNSKKIISNFDFIKADIVSLKNTIEFCKNKNDKCYIFLKFGTKKEIKFYNSIIKSDFKNVVYIFKKSQKDKFRFLDKARLIVTVDSTLGYEMIARNKKVLLLSFRDQFLKKEEKRFIHFGKNKNDVVPEGEFWINKSANNGKNIIQKLNRIDQIQPRKLANIYNKHKSSLFYKDIGNFKLKNLLS